ncbi:MAG: hypothetical protein IBJ11_05995 [Phycisphaerales bacterium]|nr:hypothetical protein [Phycisphaerales bacterium]
MNQRLTHEPAQTVRRLAVATSAACSLAIAAPLMGHTDVPDLPPGPPPNIAQGGQGSPGKPGGPGFIPSVSADNDAGVVLIADINTAMTLSWFLGGGSRAAVPIFLPGLNSGASATWIIRSPMPGSVSSDNAD